MRQVSGDGPLARSVAALLSELAWRFIRTASSLIPSSLRISVDVSYRFLPSGSLDFEHLQLR